MPPATRMRVFKQRVAVALRPGLLAAALLALAPQTAPAAPVASFTFSPPAPLTNEQVTFVSTATGATTPVKWDLDGDRLCDDAAGPLVTRSFWPAGGYAVTLCVSDGTDDATLTRRFIVQNRSPAAAIAFAPLAPMSGDTIALVSTSADPDGPIVSQDWDLDGDGAFDDAIGATASVSFEAPGTHPVGLLVTDRDGAANVATVAIPVAARPPEPITPFPVVRMAGSFGQSGIKIQQLLVRAPIGARVRVDCRGRGCPFRKMIRRARSEAIRIRRFAHHVLRPRAVIVIRVTKSGEVGKYTRFRIRKGRPPSRVDRCLLPGAKRPTACP
jgi:PKD domain-containing protein